MSDSDSGEEFDAEAQEAYEERVRERVEVLAAELEAGRVFLPPNSEVADSLRRVQRSADGRVDIRTVDSSVRAMAMAISMGVHQRELRQSVSLLEIQRIYFEHVWDQFGDLYESMREQGASPQEVAYFLSQNPDHRAEKVAHARAFLDGIESFWERAGPALHAHLEMLGPAGVAYFGGDLFPSYETNFASKCGLYVDTILLPEPFLRTKPVLAHAPEMTLIHFVIKHSLNLLNYRELACADLPTPIVVVVPDDFGGSNPDRQYLAAASERDFRDLASAAFGREFDDFEDAFGYVASFQDVETLVDALADPGLILIAEDGGGDLRERLERSLHPDEYLGLPSSETVGSALAGQWMGRLAIASRELILSRRARATTVIEAPAAWRVFDWKIRNDALVGAAEGAGKDFHVLRALQHLSGGQLRWLGSIPPEALIEIRREGAMDEIRTLLGQGVEDLVVAGPGDFRFTSQQVLGNVEAAFQDHQARLAELENRKLRFAGIDLAACLVTGTIAMCAALSGRLDLAVGTVLADQFVPTPKAHELPGKYREIKRQEQELERSPVGLFFALAQSVDE